MIAHRDIRQPPLHLAELRGIEDRFSLANYDPCPISLVISRMSTFSPAHYWPRGVRVVAVEVVSATIRMVSNPDGVPARVFPINQYV